MKKVSGMVIRGAGTCSVLAWVASCGPAENGADVDPTEVASVQQAWHEVQCSANVEDSMSLYPHPGDCSVYSQYRTNAPPYGTPGCKNQFGMRVWNPGEFSVRPSVKFAVQPTNALWCSVSGINATLITRSYPSPSLWGVSKIVKLVGQWNPAGFCTMVPAAGYTDFGWYPKHTFSELHVAAGAFHLTGTDLSYAMDSVKVQMFYSGC